MLVINPNERNFKKREKKSYGIIEGEKQGNEFNHFISFFQFYSSFFSI